MKYILSLIFSVFAICNIIAQDVWPVQLSGSLIPPRSLDLSVYGSERTQDLTFNAILVDPTETSFLARLNLSIERNGEIITQTDPNFLGMPITLLQFQNISLDGSALQQYLNPENLVGGTGLGMGSPDIPEGFNQICLQVYGVERNVPISAKFCVSGNFRLNQPPQIVKPYCGEQIKVKETQNMIFNWQPMHLGGANNPGAVEYDFEIVQMGDGVYNINDAFESALKVYRTTTPAPSLLYTQAEPALMPNKLYAWRVRATSMMHKTSKLFQNEGYSEICSFYLYDGEAPDNAINPVDNPAPKGCQVYNTDYGVIPLTGDDPFSVIDGEVVKLGYFNMQIMNINGGPQGYSGDGLIDYPMLRSLVPVTFSGLKINKDKRVYSVERVDAKLPANLQLSDYQISSENVKSTFNYDYAQSVTSSVSEYQYVSKLDESSRRVNTLPLVLKAEEGQVPLYVAGLRFTPRNAYMHVMGLKESEENNTATIYAGTHIPVTPYGVRNKSHLVPVSEYSSTSGALAGKNSPSINITESAGNGSKIYINCQGYEKEIQSKGLQFNTNIIRESEGNGPVVLKLKKTPENYDDFVDRAEKIKSFRIVGKDELVFTTAGTPMIDLSDQNKSRDIGTPKDYTAFDNPSWKGAVLVETSVTLPQKYNFINNKDRVTLDNGSLFIDYEGLAYGKFYKNDLLALSKGRARDWSYSIDQMSLTVAKDVEDEITLKGQVKLPIFDDNFGYEGSVSGDENIQVISKLEPRTLSMSMWNGKFKNLESSSLNIGIAEVSGKTKLTPSASFDGSLDISMSSKDFESAVKKEQISTLDNIKKALDITNVDFKLSDLTFNNLDIDPYAAPENRYYLGGVNLEDVEISLGGRILEFGQANIKYSSEDSGMEKLGLNVSVSSGNNAFNIIIWAKKDGPKFVFDYIEITSTILECNCTSFITPPTEYEWERIYDRILDGQFTAPDSHSGSLSSFGDASQNNFTKEYLRLVLQNGVEKSGFPMQADGSIIIPFLGNQSFDTEQKGNQYHVSSKVSDLQTITPKDLDGENTKQFPLDVTNRMNELGVKVENMPLHAKLVMTGLRSSNEDDITDASMDLMILYEVYHKGSDKRYLRFLATDLKIGPQKVNLKDVKFNLINEATNGVDNEITYLKTKKLNDKEYESFVEFNCTDGFVKFDIIGSYQSKDSGNTVKISDRDKKSPKFYFTVNSKDNKNDHSLQHFIGNLLPVNDGGNWDFTVKDAEMLSFTPGNLSEYKAYIDYDDTKRISFSDNSTLKESLKSFEGLVFEKIAFSPIGFKGKDNKNLSIPLQDALFDFDNGLKVKFVEKDILKKEDGALLGGWKYKMTHLQFLFKKNQLKTMPNGKDAVGGKNVQGVYLVGNAHIPIFDENPPKDMAGMTFGDGWVEFDGVLAFEKGASANRPSVTLTMDPAERLQLSSMIPGLGFKIAKGSTVGLTYDATLQELEPSASFTGRAGIYLVEGTAKKMGLSQKVQSATNGINFVYDLFKFQDLEINSPKLQTNCTGNQSKDGLMPGIKSLKMGTWGLALDGIGDVKQKSGKSANKALTKKFGRGFQEFPVSIGEGLGFKCFIDDDGKSKYKLLLPVSVNLMPDEQTSKNSTKKTKTAGIKADAQLNFITASNGKKFELEGVELGCMLIAGEFGPVKLSGGLNILRDETLSNTKSNDTPSKWGSGFKGGLSLEILGVKVDAVGQYGMTRFDPRNAKKETGTDINEAYRYFFLDLEATFPGGIPILPPSPVSAPLFYIRGGGGGFLYNMDLEPILGPQSEKPQAARDNNECTLAGDLLKPGKNLSGLTYRPNQEAYGGNISIILSAPTGTDPTPLAGDVNLRVGLELNDAGTIGLSYVQVDGNAYMAPSSIGSRREDFVAKASAMVRYDHQEKLITGDLGFMASFPFNKDKQSAFKKKLKDNEDKRRKLLIQKENAGKDKSATMIAADLTKLNEEEAAEIKKNDGEFKPFMILDNVNARFQAQFKDDFSWSLKLGSWGDGQGIEPASGQQFSAIRFPAFGNAALKFYLQMGKDIDGIPPILEVLPGWDGDTKSKDVGVRDPDFSKSGDGMALGVVLEINADGSIGPISGMVSGKVGFDAALMKFEKVTCGAAEGQIGMNGWYAKGQAYAFLKARLGLSYNLGFRSGEVNIFDAQMSAVVQVELPNPSYVNGFVKGKYSVLNGMLKGDFNHKFEAGEQCSQGNSTEAVIGIPIVESIYPKVDDKNKVDVFTKPTISTNWKLNSILSLPNYDDDGELVDYSNYEPRIKEFKLKDDTGSLVPTKMVYGDDNQLVSLEPYNYLKPNTKYALSYKATWYNDDNGNMTPLLDEGKKIEEDSTIYFHTGDFPDEIVAGMLESQTPGYGQRYWHKNYAKPRLLFNKADPQIKKLFPKSFEDNQGNQVPYKYTVRISPANRAMNQEAIEVDVINIPADVPYKVPVYRELNYGDKNQYSIPVIDYEDVITKEVTFPDLDGVAEKLTAGVVYKLELLRMPQIDDDLAYDADDMLSGAIAGESSVGGASFNIKHKKLSTSLLKEIAENTKVLYSYHFSKSDYESLHDKIMDTKSTFVKSKEERNDLSHPLEATFNYSYGNNPTDSHMRDNFSTKDDYYNIKLEDEGFDRYDLYRIQKNVLVERWNLNYDMEKKYRDLALDGSSSADFNKFLNTYMNSKVNNRAKASKWLLQTTAKKNYLQKVLQPIAKINEDSELPWEYEYHIAPREERLNPDEIQKGMRKRAMDNTFTDNLQKTLEDGREINGLIMQDLKSRILINQLRLLYAIAYTEKEVQVNGLSLGDKIGNGIKSFSHKLFGDEKKETTDRGTVSQSSEDKAYTKYWNNLFDNVAIGQKTLTTKKEFNKDYLDHYKFNDHSGIDFKFPVYSDWYSMNEEISTGKFIDIYMKPNHSKNGKSENFVATEQGKDEGLNTGDGLYLFMYKNSGEGTIPRACIRSKGSKSLLPPPKSIHFKLFPKDNVEKEIPYAIMYDGELEKVFFDNVSKRKPFNISLYPQKSKVSEIKDINFPELFIDSDGNSYLEDLKSVQMFVDFGAYGKYSADFVDLTADLKKVSEFKYYQMMDYYGSVFSFYDPDNIIVLPGKLDLKKHNQGGPYFGFFYNDNMGDISNKPDIGGSNRNDITLESNEWIKYSVEFKETGTPMIMKFDYEIKGFSDLQDLTIYLDDEPINIDVYEWKESFNQGSAIFTPTASQQFSEIRFVSNIGKITIKNVEISILQPAPLRMTLITNRSSTFPRLALTNGYGSKYNSSNITRYFELDEVVDRTPRVWGVFQKLPRDIRNFQVNWLPTTAGLTRNWIGRGYSNTSKQERILNTEVGGKMYLFESNFRSNRGRRWDIIEFDDGSLHMYYYDAEEQMNLNDNEDGRRQRYESYKKNLVLLNHGDFVKLLHYFNSKLVAFPKNILTFSYPSKNEEGNVTWLAEEHNIGGQYISYDINKTDLKVVSGKDLFSIPIVKESNHSYIVLSKDNWVQYGVTGKLIRIKNEFEIIAKSGTTKDATVTIYAGNKLVVKSHVIKSSEFETYKFSSTSLSDGFSEAGFRNFTIQVEHGELHLKECSFRKVP